MNYDNFYNLELSRKGNFMKTNRKRGFAALVVVLMVALLYVVPMAALAEPADVTPEAQVEAISDVAEEIPAEEGEAAEEIAEQEPAEEEETPASKAYGTLWSLLPPLIAIALALITKEVYSSLFLGILVGGLLYSNFSFEGTVVHVFQNGFIASLADSYNVGILLFLVVLGALVAMMNRAGGSAAFGQWASKHVKTKIGAQLMTIVLGSLIFIDDYFNCLTVGSVMRPVTDKHKISRAKLAYIIDATAAPICIIAPISSWAAAVSGFAKGSGMNGFQLFLSAIPFNFYAILSIVMMVAITLMKFDYGPMKLHELNAANGDLFTTGAEDFKNGKDEKVSPKGKVIDLILPVVFLIISCVIGMIYSGGFFTEGEEGFKNIITAFSNSDASVGLVYGSFVTLILSVVYFVARRVISFKDCMAAIPDGFKAMIPAIMILTCAWTLKGMTDSLGAKECIAALVEGSASGFINFLPAIIFLVAVGLSFSTGTSWGTFGILIPIVINVFGFENGNITIIAISACMAGAVCGDHCSPISDTTIMSSAGAQSNHLNHVTTQLPYALTVAAVSFVCYAIAGFVRSALVMIPVSVVLMLVTLFVINAIAKKKAA